MVLLRRQIRISLASFKPIEPVLNGQPVLGGELAIPQGLPFNTCSVPVLVLNVCVCCKSQSIMVCSCWQPSLSSMASVIKHVEF